MLELGPTVVTTGGRWNDGTLAGAPVSGDISSPFGAWEASRRRRGLGPHRGIDIAVPEGTPISAPAGGIVRAAGSTPTMGHYLPLDHDDPERGERAWTTSYLHLQRTPELQTETRASRGDEIARSGATGRYVWRAHLHFALADRINGGYVDPMPHFVAILATPPEPDARAGDCSGLVLENRMLLRTIPVLRTGEFTKQEALDAVERELREALIAAGVPPQ